MISSDVFVNPQGGQDLPLLSTTALKHVLELREEVNNLTKHLKRFNARECKESLGR